MTQPLPSMFAPHGAPTCALCPGAAGKAIAATARMLPPPRAIVVISAHGDTDQPTAGFADRLETIHDFHGFPEALYQLRYPASGCREAAHAERFHAGIDSHALAMDAYTFCPGQEP